MWVLNCKIYVKSFEQMKMNSNHKPVLGDSPAGFLEMPKISGTNEILEATLEDDFNIFGCCFNFVLHCSDSD